MQKLYVKNMVCDRCKTAVRNLLDSLHIPVNEITLGEVTLQREITPSFLQELDKQLLLLGFERIDDRKARIIEAIKQKVISVIHQPNGVRLKTNWSDIIASELKYDYNYLSSLFSSMEGITLEQYIIRQKIERVKELMFYDELTLTEIAGQLGYSSVAHLSSQFKKITGMTPGALKNSRNISASRKPLDSVD
jgi:AraC family transcriptional regulator